MFYTVRDFSGVYIFTDYPVRDEINKIWYSDTGQCIELTDKIMDNWLEEMRAMVNNLSWEDEPIKTVLVLIPKL